jgi:hypothetical protein
MTRVRPYRRDCPEQDDDFLLPKEDFTSTINLSIKALLELRTRTCKIPKKIPRLASPRLDFVQNFAAVARDVNHA